MPFPPPEECSLPLVLEAHYLLHAPSVIPPQPLLVLATHGYGMNAHQILQLTETLTGASLILASLEAPNQHYLSAKPGSDEIGFNWGTRARWQNAVSAHHKMVLGVLEQCRRRFDTPPSRCLLLGFSQPVGLNYRFAATHPDQVSGVIGICGGVPRDWEDDPSYKPVTAALLHIARDEDEYYPAETVSRFPDRLRHRAADVEFHLLPGPHRFPSKARTIVEPWLARVFPTAAL